MESSALTVSQSPTSQKAGFPEVETKTTKQKQSPPAISGQILGEPDKKITQAATLSQSLLATSENGLLCHHQKKYRLINVIGRGHYSSVYKAEDEEANPVAIKRFDEALADKDVSVENLWQEECKMTKQAEKVDHAVRLLDVFKIGSYNYLVMPLYGTPLHYFTHKPQPLCDVKHVGIQILKFLLGTKAAKLIHGDLKPENILFKNIADEKKEKEIVVIDFGLSISSEIKSKKLIQTMEYRAPEVYLDKDFEYEIDMWSLGCILFEMYTGEHFIRSFDYNDLTLATYANMLDQIHRRLGALPPDSWMEKSKNAAILYSKTDSGYVMKVKPTFDYSKFKSFEKRILARATKNDELEKGKILASLLKGMLTYEKRISPEKALEIIQTI